MNEIIREKILNRIETVMEGFTPTPEIIAKIISINDGLYSRFRMAYEDLIMMKRAVDSDIQSGRLSVSGYTIFPEYFFCYDYDNGIPTADNETLMEMSDETDWSFPSCTLNKGDEIPDFDSDFLKDDPKLSWNIEQLNLPGLEKHYIHYFMHNFFQDADTFCLADIPYIKPDDLQWQITVQYEFFNK